MREIQPVRFRLLGGDDLLAAQYESLSRTLLGRMKAYLDGAAGFKQWQLKDGVRIRTLSGPAGDIVEIDVSQAGGGCTPLPTPFLHGFFTLPDSRVANYDLYYDLFATPLPSGPWKREVLFAIDSTSLDRRQILFPLPKPTTGYRLFTDKFVDKDLDKIADGIDYTSVKLLLRDTCDHTRPWYREEPPLVAGELNWFNESMGLKSVLSWHGPKQHRYWSMSADAMNWFNGYPGSPAGRAATTDAHIVPPRDYDTGAIIGNTPEIYFWFNKALFYGGFHYADAPGPVSGACFAKKPRSTNSPDMVTVLRVAVFDFPTGNLTIYDSEPTGTPDFDNLQAGPKSFTWTQQYQVQATSQWNLPKPTRGTALMTPTFFNASGTKLCFTVREYMSFNYPNPCAIAFDYYPNGVNFIELGIVAPPNFEFFRNTAVLEIDVAAKTLTIAQGSTGTTVDSCPYRYGCVSDGQYQPNFTCYGASTEFLMNVAQISANPTTKPQQDAIGLLIAFGLSDWVDQSTIQVVFGDAACNTGHGFCFPDEFTAVQSSVTTSPALLGFHGCSTAVSPQGFGVAGSTPLAADYQGDALQILSVDYFSSQGMAFSKNCGNSAAAVAGYSYHCPAQEECMFLSGQVPEGLTPDGYAYTFTPSSSTFAVNSVGQPVAMSFAPSADPPNRIYTNVGDFTVYGVGQIARCPPATGGPYDTTFFYAACPWAFDNGDTDAPVLTVSLPEVQQPAFEQYFFKQQFGSTHSINGVPIATQYFTQPVQYSSGNIFGGNPDQLLGSYSWQGVSFGALDLRRPAMILATRSATEHDKSHKVEIIVDGVVQQRQFIDDFGTRYNLNMGDPHPINPAVKLGNTLMDSLYPSTLSLVTSFKKYPDFQVELPDVQTISYSNFVDLPMATLPKGRLMAAMVYGSHSASWVGEENPGLIPVPDPGYVNAEEWVPLLFLQEAQVLVPTPTHVVVPNVTLLTHLLKTPGQQDFSRYNPILTL